jgi:hypothetical protein
LGASALAVLAVAAVFLASPHPQWGWINGIVLDVAGAINGYPSYGHAIHRR